MNAPTLAQRLLSALLISIPLSLAAQQQQQRATVEEFFDGMLSISTSQCARRGNKANELERQGKRVDADAIRDGEVTLCDCLPNRLRQVRASLSREERSLKITEAEFSSRYIPRALAPCTAESLRRSYGGAGCADRIARRKPNPAKYCSCMSTEVAKFSEAETMELGRESADYVPAAAEAKKLGRPAPVTPPLMKRMAAMDAACSRE